MGTSIATFISLFVLLVFCTDVLKCQNYREYPYHSRHNEYIPSRPPNEDRVSNISSTFNPPDLKSAPDEQEDSSSSHHDREDYSPFAPRPPGNRPLTNQYNPQTPEFPSSGNGNGYPGSYFPGTPGSNMATGGSNKYFPKIPIGLSKYVSGDYCWEPLVNCDTANTVLYCVEGRCTCPTEWTLAPGNIPLSTVWHPSYKRCVSLFGSGCHTSPTESPQGYVYCQPGLQCIPNSIYPEVGTCGNSASAIFSSYFLISIPFMVYLLFLNYKVVPC